MNETACRLSLELRTEPVERNAAAAFDVAGEQLFVVFCENFDEHRAICSVVCGRHFEIGIVSPERRCGAHRDNGEPQLLRDLSQQRVFPRSGTVDLVHEEQCRYSQSNERPHQDTRLGLDTLNGGDDENGPVENPEDSLHLGDEVWVPWGVDEVDRYTFHRKRHHRRLDRDASPLFEGESVGLCVALVDTSELVNDSGRKEQPLGQAGLTGVDMRQYP